ncbi:hypothetical protein T06_9540 [Trichinella sp. T6]|nr:hypothetical protein T06_9540 [Trichinella sp. T6]
MQCHKVQWITNDYSKRTKRVALELLMLLKKQKKLRKAEMKKKNRLFVSEKRERASWFLASALSGTNDSFQVRDGFNTAYRDNLKPTAKLLALKQWFKQSMVNFEA